MMHGREPSGPGSTDAMEAYDRAVSEAAAELDAANAATSGLPAQSIPPPVGDTPREHGLVSVPEDSQLSSDRLLPKSGTNSPKTSLKPQPVPPPAADVFSPSDPTTTDPSSSATAASSSSSPSPRKVQYGLVQPGGRPEYESRRLSDLSKPLPVIPDPTAAAEASNLPEQDALSGSLIDARGAGALRDSPFALPPQHLPRPVAEVDPATGQPPSPTLARTPSRRRNADPARLDALSIPASAVDGPFSPPDADPARTLADSNRNSIDDIRRNHAARNAHTLTGIAPVPGLVAAATPSSSIGSPVVKMAATPTPSGHQQYYTEASPSSAAAASSTARHRRSIGSEPPRPASVLETRAAKQEAASRHAQLHSHDGSSDTMA